MSVEAEQPDPQEIVAALAKLPLIEYDRQRKDKARDLGIRASILDMLVAQARPETAYSSQAASRPSAGCYCTLRAARPDFPVKAPEILLVIGLSGTTIGAPFDRITCQSG